MDLFSRQIIGWAMDNNMPKQLVMDALSIPSQPQIRKVGLYCRFADRKAAKMEILDYITFYNANLLHSTLGYRSPMDYEKEQPLIVA